MPQPCVSEFQNQNQNQPNLRLGLLDVFITMSPVYRRQNAESHNPRGVGVQLTITMRPINILHNLHHPPQCNCINSRYYAISPGSDWGLPFRSARPCQSPSKVGGTFTRAYRSMCTTCTRHTCYRWCNTP